MLQYKSNAFLFKNCHSSYVKLCINFVYQNMQSTILYAHSKIKIQNFFPVV